LRPSVGNNSHQQIPRKRKYTKLPENIYFGLSNFQTCQNDENKKRNKYAYFYFNKIKTETIYTQTHRIGGMHGTREIQKFKLRAVPMTFDSRKIVSYS
jgi:hypothetical protein